MQPGTVERGSLLAGRYRIGSELGRGGMAEVYEAIDERLARPVAVKLLRPEMAARPDVRSRFEAEARSAASLSHPNVVAVYDTGEDDGTAFIVMERLPGETLADRIANGSVEEDWLRRVAGDVLQALRAAHAAGIVHRDVKPGNILIADNGCAKVADFGIAKSAEVAAGADAARDLTSTNQLVGTPAYVAPERIDGEMATPLADIYALGVVLYEALAGRKPFSGLTPIAVAHAVQQGEPTPLREVRPDIDPGFAAMIHRAMARRPEDRFGSADDMLAALDGGTADMPLDATRVLPAAGALDATAVARRPPRVERGAARPRRAVAPPPPASDRRWIPVAVIGTILLLGLIVLLSRTGGDAADQAVESNAGAPGAAAQPSSPLARELMAVATRLDVGDGDGGRQVAGGLRRVAAAVEGGGGGKEATDVLRQVVTLSRAGDLGRTATNDSIAVLRRVPGVDTSVLQAPAASGGDGDGDKDEEEKKKDEEKGKGQGKDD